MAGCSICWFNTVCFVLCVKNFPINRPLALALTVSFNGVSAALYSLTGNAINSSSTSLYLLLNALVPLLVSVAALIPILRQPSLDPLPPDGVKRDQFIFLILNFIAVVTGIYLLLFGSKVSNTTTAPIFFAGAILLLLLPLGIPGIVYARDWFHRTVHSSFQLEGSGFILVDVDDLEQHKERITREASATENGGLTQTLLSSNGFGSFAQKSIKGDALCESVMITDKLQILGEEHRAWLLIRRLDFWLYFFAYFCGGTIGLVYSNNLGQIAQSLGQYSSTKTLVTLYSAFSFFGRLLSAAPDYLRT